MNKKIKSKYIAPVLISLVGFASSLGLATSVVSADAANKADGPSSSTSNQTTELQNIITKGNAAISVRLSTLSGLVTIVNSTTNKLTSSDRAYLLSEINSEQTGLTSLQTTLDGETTVAAARTDFQNIYTQYRVYAVIAPKVHMIKAADDQQAAETNLSNLETKLQTRINAETAAGKDMSEEQALLTSAQTDTTNAQAISSNIEQSVLTISPTQYDNNHAILSGDFAQLKQADSDIKTAFSDAKQIVSDLKSLN